MPFLRKYGTLTVTGTTSIRFPLIKRSAVDFAVGADYTPVAGDIKIAIDGAAPTNVTNLPTAVASGNGAYWDWVATAAELTCKQAIVTIVDAATKAVEDQCLVIETFGNASAMYAADLSLANLPANVTQLLGTVWLTPGTAGTPDVNAKQVGGTAQTARDLGLALPAVAPNAAGGLLITAAGSLDMDDLAADVDATETRVTTALPNAAPQAAGGLITSTSGSLDLDEMNVDIEAIQAKTDNLPAAPASTTNITGGTITTVTNLTNAPTAGDFTAAMKTSLNSATPTVTVSDKTGFSLNLAQALSVSPSAGTLGQALSAALGDAIGKIVYAPPASNPGTGSITVYASDGTTVLKTSTVTTDSSGNVLSRV